MGRPAGPGSFASLAHARMNWHTPSQMTSKLSMRVRRRLVVGGWSSPLAWWPMGHPWRATFQLRFPPGLWRYVAPARLRRLADPQTHEDGRSRSRPGAARWNERRKEPTGRGQIATSCLHWVGYSALWYYCARSTGTQSAAHPCERGWQRMMQRSGSHGIGRTCTPDMALLATPRTVTASPFVLLRTANSCPTMYTCNCKRLVDLARISVGLTAPSSPRSLRLNDSVLQQSTDCVPRQDTRNCRVWTGVGHKSGQADPQELRPESGTYHPGPGSRPPG